MSTITKEFTKEQLIARADHLLCVGKAFIADHPGYDGMAKDVELFKIALASLEAEAVCVIDQSNLDYLKSGSDADVWPASRTEMGDVLLYRAAPPAPVSVPDDYFSSLVAAARVRADKAMRKFPQPNYVLNKVAEESGEVIKAVIHFTEGREEWQNVEGEIIDNLAMLIRLVMEGDQVIGFAPPDACRSAMLQGAEPVKTANKLPFEQWLSQQTGTIDVECGCVMTEVFFHWLRVAYEAGNSPVITDGWVMVPKEATPEMINSAMRDNETGEVSEIYELMLAAAPQQEVK
ncbi:TPA: hypothetical protein ACOEP3_000949 [Enterobacter hormaechei subsp. xiangfangensis]